MMEETLKTAVERKRKYPTLNALISDDSLRTHVAKYEAGDQGPLTVGFCLLRDHWEPSFPPAEFLRSLEGNLALFVPNLSSAGKKSFAANLLNGRDQFLNTLSELGLARHYLKQKWEVRLAESLPLAKDVDLYLKSANQERWLDVINAAPSEWEGSGFVPLVPRDFRMRLQNKVVDKFREKFSKEIENGWSGLPWIALDFTKNDAIAVSITLQQMIGELKLEAFAEKILEQCPKLAGVVYYTYYACDSSVRWIKECGRP